MAIYVRRKPERYELVESHREDGRVVVRYLKGLGATRPTPEELEQLKEEYKDRVPPKSGNGRKRKKQPEKGDPNG